MSTTTDRQLSEVEGKLVVLLNEARADAKIHSRVQLWIARMAGGKPLNEYLRARDIPLKERLTLGQALVDILLAKTYDRLPPLGETPEPEIPAEADPSGIGPDQLRAMIRAEVRRELGEVLGTISKVLKE